MKNQLEIHTYIAYQIDEARKQAEDGLIAPLICMRRFINHLVNLEIISPLYKMKYLRNIQFIEEHTRKEIFRSKID